MCIRDSNSCDCGVFVCISADFLSNGWPLTYTQEHIAQCRVRIAHGCLNDCAVTDINFPRNVADNMSVKTTRRVQAVIEEQFMNSNKLKLAPDYSLHLKIPSTARMPGAVDIEDVEDDIEEIAEKYFKDEKKKSTLKKKHVIKNKVDDRKLPAKRMPRRRNLPIRTTKVADFCSGVKQHPLPDPVDVTPKLEDVNKVIHGDFTKFVGKQSHKGLSLIHI